MTSLLTWEPGSYNTHTGSAGGVRLFSVTWKSRREDPNYLMRSDLPGYEGREWKDDDREKLQARAEQLLSQWLAKVGGPLPAEHAEYSLSGEDAYTSLTGGYDLSMTGANSLIFLAAAFGEARIPFRGMVLTVGYAEGYYRVTCEQVRSTP
jgi:hypothetical protein